MRYTIEGFSQEAALTLRSKVEVNGKIVTRKIDCTDLVILRWFVDFYPSMKKMEVDGRQYAWLSHRKLLQDLPIVDITKRAFIDRMQKLVDFGVLDYRLVKDGGTFSLYTFGSNYEMLVKKREGMQSNGIGAGDQPHTKDSNNKNSSIKKSIKDITIIVDFLNSCAGTSYRATSKATQGHINARLAEGFTVDDFKAVISKKCAEWKGGEMEKYLRPETLFGSKFENYLNAPAVRRKTYGETGVEIAPQQEADILDGIL